MYRWNDKSKIEDFQKKKSIGIYILATRQLK